MRAKTISSVVAAGVMLVLGTTCQPAATSPVPVGYLAKVGVYGDLDRHPVRFDHDRHTKQLGDDACGRCHHEKDVRSGKLEYKKGHEYTCETCHGAREHDGIRGLTDAFHDTCLTCHRERSQEKKNTGPRTCAGCHVKGPLPERVEPVTFEHAWHMSVMESDDSCGACHHVWDEKAGKLVYAKGKEAACDTCHGEPSAKYVKTNLVNAVHGACVKCHREGKARGAKKVGPKVCAGCHEPKNYPRPYTEPTVQKQPHFEKADLILIGRPDAVMPGVPFNHKQHQTKTPDCIVCHTTHVFAMADYTENLAYLGERCNLCHSAAKDAMPEDVRKRLSMGLSPEAAYHDEKAPASCIGCHKARNTKGPKQFKACSSCHSGEKGLEAMKKGLPNSPAPPEETKWPEKGPDVYLIQELARDYEPVQFPHADHKAMAIKCETCHHHVKPTMKKTPRCKTCHKRAFDPGKPNKPHVVGADHQRCMGCHRNMGLGPVACKKCHQARR